MVSGGRRAGAGRPKGKPKKRIVIPADKLDAVMEVLDAEPMLLPLYSSRVPAGFPSPADDHMDTKLDLNKFLIHRPASTFLAWAQGDSMEGEKIFDGDLVIVDRSIEARSGHIVVAVIDGQQTIKKLLIRNGKAMLVPANPKYQPIEITEDMDTVIWGVVKHNITIREV